MALYVFLNNDLDHYVCGSSVLLYIDNRLSNENKVLRAKEVIKNRQYVSHGVYIKANFSPTYIGFWNPHSKPTNILKL